MQNTPGYCENCNAQRMLIADDPGFGTVLLICMLGPIGLLIVLMGRGREKGLCAVCGTTIQVASTQKPPRSIKGTRRQSTLIPRRMSPIIMALLGFCFIWWCILLPIQLFLFITGSSTEERFCTPLESGAVTKSCCSQSLKLGSISFISRMKAENSRSPRPPVPNPSTKSWVPLTVNSAGCDDGVTNWPAAPCTMT